MQSKSKLNAATWRMRNVNTTSESDKSYANREKKKGYRWIRKAGGRGSKQAPLSFKVSSARNALAVTPISMQDRRGNVSGQA